MQIELSMSRVQWLVEFWPLLVIALVLVVLSVFAFVEDLKYRKLCRELESIKEGCNANTKEA